jgi:hypothetical protein
MLARGKQSLLVVMALFELLWYDLRRWIWGARANIRCAGRPEASAAAISTTCAKIRTAVQTAVALYPRRVQCLQYAVSAARLLRRCGFRAEFVVGYCLRPLRCHAWVEVDGRPFHRGEAYHDMMIVLYRAQP